MKDIRYKFFALVLSTLMLMRITASVKILPDLTDILNPLFKTISFIIKKLLKLVLIL